MFIGAHYCVGVHSEGASQFPYRGNAFIFGPLPGQYLFADVVSNLQVYGFMFVEFHDVLLILQFSHFEMRKNQSPDWNSYGEYCCHNIYKQFQNRKVFNSSKGILH